MTNHPQRLAAAKERSLAHIAERYEPAVAELIELAGDAAWGAIKAAMQRGRDVAASPARVLNAAAALYDAGAAVGSGDGDEIDALAGATIEHFGLEPLWDRFGGLEAVSR